MRHLTSLMIVFLFTLAACYRETSSGPTDPIVHSDHNQFVGMFALIPEDPVVGANTIMLELTTPAGRVVSGAELDVVEWMPAMGHGSNGSPNTRESTEGTYSIAGLVYSMPGTWEVQITAHWDHISDRLVIPLEVH